MTFQVESHVPMPSSTATGRTSKYPFAEMQVGDSFRFAHDHHLRASIANTARTQWKDRKFTTQAVIEDGQRYFRIWRVK